MRAARRLGYPPALTTDEALTITKNSRLQYVRQGEHPWSLVIPFPSPNLDRKHILRERGFVVGGRLVPPDVVLSGDVVTYDSTTKLPMQYSQRHSLWSM